MFAKPLAQIEYSDIEAFCSRFGEGVRVEYKREMIENIPKTISAFANTLGGIMVIGVETDNQNKVIAINGIDKKAGIEEGIIDSSLNGIYPSVIPEVRIFEIPEKKNKVVAVIKVHESIQAPHAIQNSTRVYIRTGSTSQPYELAEIDRIEYMLKRREQPERLKEELRVAALNRVERFLREPGIAPYFYISILPVFPHQPLISLDEMYAFCRGIRYGAVENLYIDDPDRITDGICKFHGNKDNFLYREINHYGLIFICETVDKMESRFQPIGREHDKRLYINFVHFVSILGRTLRLSEMFYGKCGYLGNLEVRIDVKNIGDEFLLYNDEVPGFAEYKAIDNSTFSSKAIIAEDIAMCLTPDSRIGKVFCINPKGINRVKKIFRKKKLDAHINSIPDLNWGAYGRLLCQYCTQLRIVFKKANELRQEGKEITVPNLNKMKLPKMATSDIHRALKRLIELKLMICDDAKPKRFTITNEGLLLIEYTPGTLLI